MSRIERIITELTDYAEDVAQDDFRPTNIDNEAVSTIERLLQTIKERIARKGGNQ